MPPPRLAERLLRRVLPALICPVVFSLASARMIAKPDLRQVLASQGGRGSTATTKGRSVLVVAHVALAVILLTASSLAFKSIRGAFSQPLGMTVDRLLIFGMEFNDAIYPDLPGARPAADTARDALTGARADAAAVLGVSLRAGSWWAEGTDGSAVISEATARRYFDGVTGAVGRHLSLADGGGRAVYQVVGVATDIANTDRTEAPPPRAWIPMPPPTRRMTFIVEGHDPASVAADVRRVAATVAPAVPIEGLGTFSEALVRAERSDYLGLLVGLAGGVGVGFTMGSMLFGTSPADPATLGAVSAMLVAVALAATALPAWRASRIDPAVALRAE